MEAHALDVEQLLEVDLQQGEGLEPAYKLLIVVREAQGAVAPRGQAAAFAGEVVYDLPAVLKGVVRAAEFPELRFDAQLVQKRESAVEHRAVDVVRLRRLQLAASAELAAGLQRLEFPVEHEGAYGVVHGCYRAGDDGPCQFFRCQVFTPPFLMRFRWSV